MAKIIGNTVGVPNPQPDWNQADPTKADYIKNKPAIGGGDGAIGLDGIITSADYNTTIVPGVYQISDTKGILIVNTRYYEGSGTQYMNTLVTDQGIKYRWGFSHDGNMPYFNEWESYATELQLSTVELIISNTYCTKDELRSYSGTVESMFGTMYSELKQLCFYGVISSNDYNRIATSGIYKIDDVGVLIVDAQPLNEVESSIKQMLVLGECVKTRTGFVANMEFSWNEWSEYATSLYVNQSVGELGRAIEQYVGSTFVTKDEYNTNNNTISQTYVAKTDYNADKETIAQTYVTKTTYESDIGDIESALDAIISVQNGLIGGGSV